MASRVVAWIITGLLACTASGAAPPAKKIWITVGEAAYAQLREIAPQAIARESRVFLPDGAALLAGREQVHLVEVDEQQMLGLSAAVHHTLRRCGGFMAHASEAEGLAVLNRQAEASQLAVPRPSYAIDQQAVVTPMLAQMQASNIGQTIVDLSAFTNRYYTTSNGVNASNWLRQRWSAMTAGRGDISVSQVTHAAFPQKSVVATIAGTDNAAQVVVLGAHLDSVAGRTIETTRAPGADDDASGIASMTEALRVMVAIGYRPRRTIKLIGYAAEEVGLRGSQDIARQHKAGNVDVVGVLQLDMTNYKGSAGDIYIYTDYTDSQQNDFLARLLGAYLPELGVGYDRCGYGCSDHAAWTGQGYWSSMPFETSFSQRNPHIHTASDTYASSGNQAAHALKFARLGLAFAVELGSDGTGTPPPPGPEKVQTYNGALNLGQRKIFGPFKAGAGSFKAALSGSGNVNLYLRRNLSPTNTVYDCKSDGPGSAERCALTLSAAGDMYVSLYGDAAASAYTLTATYRPQ